MTEVRLEGGASLSPDEAPTRSSWLNAGWKIAATAVTVVALTLSTAAGTYAFLTAQASTQSQDIRSGTLGVDIIAPASGSLGAWSYITPAASQARAFTVQTNAEATTGMPAALDMQISAAASPIVGNARARITEVANVADCQPGLSGTYSALSGYTYSTPPSVTVSPGVPRIYCLEIGLDPSTPVTLAGSALPFTLTVTARQKET